ncbi:MAG TPA: ornithine cyclodeaminase family protein [Trueperaceae bacterium]|nr:ornithine cyclodeaminase family protein [Trueperaceae bacterium]
MRVLNREQVTRLLPMQACIPLMETALAALSRGDAQLPLRSVMPLPPRHDVLAVMPAQARAPAALGAKIITVFPGNQQRGLDAHQGAVLVFDPEDGRLLGLLDASSITAIRTAAVSAVATGLLARPDASSLALLGSHVQAWSHLEALALVRPLARVRVWSRTPEHAADFVARARRAYDLDVAACASAAEAVRGADIVCTVTASRRPVLEGAWLEPGMHVNAVGASQPDARELDSEAVARSRLFADRRESLVNESAAYLTALREGRLAEDQAVPELGEVLEGTAEGRTSDDEITLFKSLGLAIEDLLAARHVLRRAEEEGVGTVVALEGG